MIRCTRLQTTLICVFGCVLLLVMVSVYHGSRNLSVVCSQHQTGVGHSLTIASVCSALINNSTEFLQRRFSRDNQVCEKEAGWYLNNTCNHISAGYITNSSRLPPEELSTSIAFSILMYKDVWQFERLLRAIYRPHHFYCIHVDLKSSHSVFNSVRQIATCFDNVFVVDARVDVEWCGSSQIDAELACMRELLLRSKNWSWFINLTGQEFPLRTMWELVRVLTALNGTNSIQIGAEWFADDRRKQQLLPFTTSHNMTAAYGATHVVAVRDFVDFAVNHALAKSFAQFLEGKKCPDEAFFSTLNSNGHLDVPGGTTIAASGSVNGTRGFINRLKRFWNAVDVYPPCQSGFWRHDVCIFGVADLPFIVHDARFELFINKLYWNYEHWTLDCLEWWHTTKTNSQYEQYRAFGIPPSLPLVHYHRYARQFRPGGGSVNQ